MRIQKNSKIPSENDEYTFTGKTLGQGSFAIVYEAESKTLKKKVAINNRWVYHQVIFPICNR